jgi:hypothetical protein
VDFLSAGIFVDVALAAVSLAYATARLYGRYARTQSSRGSISIPARVEREQTCSSPVSMNDLGEMHPGPGDIANAGSRFDAALEPGRRSLGEQHHATIRSMDDMAACFESKGTSPGLVVSVKSPRAVVEPRSTSVRCNSSAFSTAIRQLAVPARKGSAPEPMGGIAARYRQSSPSGTATIAPLEGHLT